MTVQEAIAWVRNRMASGCTKDECWQAGEMAIEALKKQVLYEQVQWERDVAISQLESIGVSLGMKMDDVKEALEKQIPKKVIKERGECYTISRDGIEGYLIYFECPSCGNKLLHKNFPCKCGQKLDWGD